ncbi:helix-turn-helix transcriptional regulator [Cytobacillus sp. IB215316]|uniref:helix-turn-helix domain-containing protein n=1 Tax=Cytobacillus sp. IB215316 TaxID=3097354 RepID=UPI002A14C754|nr:helix-turn-helix transcriptional regulator [Cytobacillus sp. IB215316]MDX8362026.1 helix-turn-helix transcriptional regulator [Cytobacillus sp. IB215316]
MDGCKVKEIRIMQGISLSELSKLSGVSKSYLSIIERGIQKNPSIEIICKIAAALNVNVEKLISPNDEKYKHKEIDNEVLALALEFSQVDIDKEKVKKFKEFIELLK